jgi:hypothetical protein
VEWFNSALTGVLAGGLLTFGTTMLTNRSTAQRDDRKAQAAASARRREDWAAFQIQTIADLQEQLDAISPVLGVSTNDRELRGVLKAMAPGSQMPAHLVAYSRAMMLCSRLEHANLAARIRTWLNDTRTAIAGTLDDEFERLRDERLAIQADLGLSIKKYHDSYPVPAPDGRSH